MTFGEKVQLLRKKKGLSQEGLAEKLSVTRQTISKWELDRSTPDLQFILQLSDIFEVTTDYLIKDNTNESDRNAKIKKDSEENRAVLSEKPTQKTIYRSHFMSFIGTVLIYGV